MDLTVEQAVVILDRAASNAQLTREDHFLVQKSVKLLQDYIAKHESGVVQAAVPAETEGS